ncbi:uncharacterized protein LOC128246523 [Mya arenaria]|uniref:uncharacterized protein LOC128246523 n=1 Tax=Mya arenaria TaxID=6604 RepID=UPI0022E02F0B|nr:uncharacterized protein LOC128246523 [Mya arenaria]
MGTYRILLDVNKEQETAIKELFSVRGWLFLCQTLSDQHSQLESLSSHGRGDVKDITKTPTTDRHIYVDRFSPLTQTLDKQHKNNEVESLEVKCADNIEGQESQRVNSKESSVAKRVNIVRNPTGLMVKKRAIPLPIQSKNTNINNTAVTSSTDIVQEVRAPRLKTRKQNLIPKVDYNSHIEELNDKADERRNPSSTEIENKERGKYIKQKLIMKVNGRKHTEKVSDHTGIALQTSSTESGNSKRIPKMKVTGQNLITVADGQKLIPVADGIKKVEAMSDGTDVRYKIVHVSLSDSRLGPKLKKLSVDQNLHGQKIKQENVIIATLKRDFAIRKENARPIEKDNVETEKNMVKLKEKIVKNIVVQSKKSSDRVFKEMDQIVDSVSQGKQRLIKDSSVTRMRRPASGFVEQKKKMDNIQIGIEKCSIPETDKNHSALGLKTCLSSVEEPSENGVSSLNSISFTKPTYQHCLFSNGNKLTVPVDILNSKASASVKIDNKETEQFQSPRNIPSVMNDAVNFVSEKSEETSGSLCITNLQRKKKLLEQTALSKTMRNKVLQQEEKIENSATTDQTDIEGNDQNLKTKDQSMLGGLSLNTLLSLTALKEKADLQARQDIGNTLGQRFSSVQFNTQTEAHSENEHKNAESFSKLKENQNIYEAKKTFNYTNNQRLVNEAERFNFAQRREEPKLRRSFSNPERNTNKFSKTATPASDKNLNLEKSVLSLLPKEIAANVRNQLKIRRTQSGPKSGRLICPYCPNHGLVNPISFIKHLERHAKGDYKCKGCGKEFTDQRNLNAHMYKSKFQTLSCELCDFVAKTKCMLKTHHRETHIEKGIQCHICAKLFKARSYFNVHLRVVHKVADSKTLECGLCGTLCKRPFYLAKHMKEHHHGQVEPLKCQFCLKTFRTRRDLIVHGRIHRERKFKCTFCAKKFMSNAKLHIHMNVHLGKKPFECPKCDYKSTQKGNIDLHLRRHEREEEKIEKDSSYAPKKKYLPAESNNSTDNELIQKSGLTNLPNRKRSIEPLPGIKTMNRMIHTLSEQTEVFDDCNDETFQTEGFSIQQFSSPYDEYDELEDESESDNDYTSEDENFDKESDGVSNGVNEQSDEMHAAFTATKVVDHPHYDQNLPYKPNASHVPHVNSVASNYEENFKTEKYFDNHQANQAPNIENLSTSDIIKQFGQQGDLELDTEVLLNIQKYAHSFEELLKNTPYDVNSQYGSKQTKQDFGDSGASNETVPTQPVDNQSNWNYNLPNNSATGVDYDNVDLSGFYQAVQNLAYSDCASYFDSNGHTSAMTNPGGSQMNTDQQTSNTHDYYNSMQDPNNYQPSMGPADTSSQFNNPSNYPDQFDYNTMNYMYNNQTYHDHLNQVGRHPPHPPQCQDQLPEGQGHQAQSQDTSEGFSSQNLSHSSTEQDHAPQGQFHNHQLEIHPPQGHFQAHQSGDQVQGHLSKGQGQPQFDQQTYMDLHTKSFLDQFQSNTN